MSLTTIEHWSGRILDAITTLILIRNLNVISLGVFVVYQSWVAILLLFFPALESILYREYATLKATGKLAEHFGIFRKFNLIKLTLALSFTLLFSVPMFGETSWFIRFSALALAFALPLSQAIYGIYRETLRFELKPGIIVIINTLQRLAIIAVILYASQVSHGAMESISLSALAIFVCFGFVWAFTGRYYLHIIKEGVVSYYGLIPKIILMMKQTIFWLHINGIIIGAIQTLDIYFLSYFKTDLREIVIYSIALKAANFFQVIPMPFANALMVYIGRKNNETKDLKFAYRFVMFSTFLFLGLGIFIFLAGFITAHPLLAFLSKGKFSELELLRAKQYFLWQLGGVAIFSLYYATIGYLNNRANLKKVSVGIYIPWFIFTVIGYAWAAHQGPMITAIFNIPVYFTCIVLHMAGFWYWMRKSLRNPL